MADPYRSRANCTVPACNANYTCRIENFGVVTNEVVHEIGDNTNGVGQLFGARWVMTQMAFGEHHSSYWETDSMLQRLLTDHDFGTATTNINHQSDAVMWQYRNHDR